MPTIRFVKPYPDIIVNKGETLMKCLLKAGLPVASSCDGDGVCGKCRLQVEGAEASTNAPSALEVELAKKYSLKPNQRISCQTLVLDDILVDATYW